MSWTRIAAMLSLLGCSSGVSSVGGYWNTTEVELEEPDRCARFDPRELGWQDRESAVRLVADERGVVLFESADRESAIARSSGAAAELYVAGQEWELFVVVGEWANPNGFCVELDTMACIDAASSAAIVCVFRGELSARP